MSEAGLAPLRRALISVSDKTGIVAFARSLAERGVEILSTGGTCRLLRDEGIAVTEVSDHTGFPEMMDGRVKTLHPKIHGGILGRRGTDDQVMSDHDIPPIDLGGRQPLPVRGDRRARRLHLGRRGGEYRYRWTHDGARRG